MHEKNVLFTTGLFAWQFYNCSIMWKYQNGGVTSTAAENRIF